MSNTIDILTVVDAVSVLEAVADKKLGGAGTASNPYNLGANGTSDAYIYMITASEFVVNNQAKSELTVKANVGDTVRWMGTCPGGGTSSNVILTNWHAGSGENLINPLSLDLSVKLYVGSATVPPTAVNYEDYCYSGMVTGSGSVQYTITFQLIDENGNSQGYFIWDPFINISN
ncbi:MAG: AidA/PixA family protein [Kordia sp.]|uniref:AidA/PixA family protein n=1 Tax=Kordia sp. TaxID=1965332 RepID=UPI00385AF9F6